MGRAYIEIAVTLGRGTCDSTLQMITNFSMLEFQAFTSYICVENNALNDYRPCHLIMLTDMP